MLVSLKNVSQYVDLKDLTAEDIADKLTFAGVEVEDIRKLASGTNLVIGHILECVAHPNSDHLHVLKVDLGPKYGVTQIVCGAPNARTGLKVIVARVGAILPQIEIKKGCTYPNSDKEEDFDDKWLPTPWNEIEVGMGAMANIPILLVRDDKVEIGVFDKIINEFKMKTMSTAIPLAQINNNEEFMKWLDLFVGTKTDKEFKEKMNN